jgi:hypothetical protein
MAETAVQAAVAEKPPNGAEATPGVRCKVKDLNLGDLVVVEGFDGPKTVLAATKVRSGPDCGKLEVQLVGADDSVETARFNPDEEFTVVGKNAVPANPPKKGGKKNSGKGKSQSEPKGERAGDKAVKPEPEKGKPRPDKAGKAKPTKATGDKRMSALDAAAKVLGETGQAMNCQEMIKAMSEKGYWKSPGGLTPHATLYSAILRELKAKGAEARFRRTERGKFSAASA